MKPIMSKALLRIMLNIIVMSIAVLSPLMAFAEFSIDNFEPPDETNIDVYGPTATRLVSLTGTDSGDCVLNPCRTIQFAIDQAANGDVIKIFPGTYYEKLAITSRSNLVLKGTSSTKTVIQGDHSFSQIRIQSSTDIIVMDMTIRDGGDSRHNEGGAIQIFGLPKSRVTLKNLILFDNTAVNGGAIEVENADLKIINCLLHNNRAANVAGAMLVRAGGIVTMETTTITNNSGNYLSGGIIIEGGAQIAVRNSILWKNNQKQIDNDTFRGLASVNFSDIQGGYPGVANINQDPLFQDAANGNFRLSRHSPAIDVGRNADAPATDLDGKCRPIDGNHNRIPIVDMGAFEFGRSHFDCCH